MPSATRPGSPILVEIDQRAVENSDNSSAEVNANDIQSVNGVAEPNVGIRVLLDLSRMTQYAIGVSRKFN